MTQITATVVSQPITASVNAGGSISASVGSSVVTANAGGGIGPQGPAGTTGGNLGQLTDVQVVAAQNGDVLRYSSGKWRNHPEGDIVIDGQNF
jgi:hypothetical protein